MNEEGEPEAEEFRDGRRYLSALGDTLERWCNERCIALTCISEIDAVLTGASHEFSTHLDDALIVADAHRFWSRWTLGGMVESETEGTTTELRELFVAWFDWCDAHVLWIMPQRVVLKVGGGSSPVWDASGARADIGYPDIPVGSELVLRLKKWSESFDASFDFDEGRTSGLRDDAELAAFDAESASLAEAMRAELDDAYRVDRLSYLTGTIEPDPRGRPPMPSPQAFPL